MKHITERILSYIQLINKRKSNFIWYPIYVLYTKKSFNDGIILNEVIIYSPKEDAFAKIAVSPMECKATRKWEFFLTYDNKSGSIRKEISDNMSLLKRSTGVELTIDEVVHHREIIVRYITYSYVYSNGRLNSGREFLSEPVFVKRDRLHVSKDNQLEIKK